MSKNKRLKTEAIRESGSQRVKESGIEDKRQETKSYHLISISLILVISIAIYSNTFKNGFVYDDHFTIVDNIFIKDWKNLSDLLSKDYFSRSGEATYRPVVTLSYFIDYYLWGLKPFGYHLTNLLLHSVNVILFYLFTISLLRDRGVAFLAALLFAVHPVLTEAVNAISYREDILIVVFLLPSFLLFLKISNSSMNKIRWWTFYILSLLLYLLALFSKEMAVTFPLLLVVYYICFKDKEGWQKGSSFFYYFSGYTVVTIFYLFLYLAPFINPDLTPFGSHKPEGFSYPNTLTRLLTLPQVLLKYLWLIMVPWKLTADYVVKFSLSWAEPSVLFSIFLLSVIGAAVFHLSKIYRKELFGLLWFFVSLLPVMNIVPINNVIAERYLYLPFVGISLLCSSWLVCLNRAKVNLSRYALKREVVTIIIGLIILVYGGRTIFRNMDWRDDLILWSQTIIVSPESAKAHNNLGKAYDKLGRFQEAIKEYQIALHFLPDNPDQYKPDQYKLFSNLGRAYASLNRWQEAVEEYQKALRIRPSDADAHNNLGIAYTSLGRWQEAIAEYQRTIEFKSDHPDAHYNMGIAYANLGRWQEAVEEYKKSLAIKQDDPDAHNNIGVIYYEQNRIEDALKEWEAALSINPDHEQAKKNIEGLKAIRGKPP